MRWPWSKPQVLTGDLVVRCPSCKSTRPKAGFHKLWQSVVRKGKVVSWEEGGALLCEECGTVFCFDLEGAYLPAKVVQAQAPRPDQRPEQEQPPMPLPKARTPARV